LARRDSHRFQDEVAECRLHHDAETADLLLACRGDGLQRLLRAMEAPAQLLPASGGEGDAGQPQPAENPAPAVVEGA